MYDVGDCIHPLLAGFALGDALGYATQGRSLEAIRQQYGDAGITTMPDYSDATPRFARLMAEPEKGELILFGEVPGTDVLVKMACEKLPPEHYLKQLVAYFVDDPVYETALLRVGHVLGWGSEERALRHLGQGEHAAEILSMALYCILRYEASLPRAVLRAANTDGASDKIAAIVGMVMTIYHGMDAIPPSWRGTVPGFGNLPTLIERFAGTIQERLR